MKQGVSDVIVKAIRTINRGLCPGVLSYLNSLYRLYGRFFGIY
jgi:hypothetical protein